MPRLTPEQIAARFEARQIRGAITTVRGHGELTRFIGFSGVRTPHILPKPNVLFDFVAPGLPPIIQNNQAGHLVAAFAAGQEASEQHPTFQWTHILFCRRAAIIGDLFPAAPAPATVGSDTSKNKFVTVFSNPPGPPLDPGVVFDVVLVEQVHRRRPNWYQRAYLRRRPSLIPA